MHNLSKEELEELTELWLKDHDPDYSNPHRNKQEYPYLSGGQQKRIKYKESIQYNDNIGG